MTRAPFLFGKLPAHGDFVARGLSPSEAEAWDTGLSSSLAAARDAYGDTFPDRYAAAPPWRFCRGGEAGAIAPSVDRAGRRFPIVVGVRGGDAGDAAACEDAIFEGLASGADADALLASLGVPAAAANHPGDWWVDGGAEAGIAALTGPLPRGLLTAMLAVVEPVS